jgi:hypothetical protein
VRFRKWREYVVTNTIDKGQLGVDLPTILREAARLVAAIVRRVNVEVSRIVLERSNQRRSKLIVLLRRKIRVVVADQTEAVSTCCRRTLYVAGLPAKEARSDLDAVIALRPAQSAGILERVVDILKWHISSISKIGEGTY